MKKLIYLWALALVFAACGSSDTSQEEAELEDALNELVEEMEAEMDEAIEEMEAEIDSTMAADSAMADTTAMMEEGHEGHDH